METRQVLQQGNRQAPVWAGLGCCLCHPVPASSTPQPGGCGDPGDQQTWFDTPRGLIKSQQVCGPHQHPAGLHWPPPATCILRGCLLPAEASRWLHRDMVLGTELHASQGDSWVRGLGCLLPWDHWECGGSGPCTGHTSRAGFGGLRGWCPRTPGSSACWEQCPHIPTAVSPAPF